MKPSFLKKAEVEICMANCNYWRTGEPPKYFTITNVAVTGDYDLLYKQIWDIHFTKYPEDEIIPWDGIELTRKKWLENNIKLCENWLEAVYPKWLTEGKKLYSHLGRTYGVKHAIERYYEVRNNKQYIMEEALILALIRNRYPIRIADTKDISHILGMSKLDYSRISALCRNTGVI